MRRHAALIVALILATALAGLAGGWLGVRHGLAQASHAPGLDEVLHRTLHLDAAQARRIAALEAGFAVRRRALETEMRAANADLARAIVTEHAYGPSAERAIGRFHAAMGELQRETVIHVMTVRRVLTAGQA
nr:periplasmic heavy metal sensor [Caulobacteraceae bacterium]